MAQQTLNDGVSFGEQRSKINSNFTELYSTKTTNTNAAITGGTINGAVIGGTTPAAGSFTTLSAGDLSVAGLIRAGNGAASPTGGIAHCTPAGVEAALELYQVGIESWKIKNPANSSDLVFANSGSDRLRLSWTGNLSVTGNVGIGVTPSAWGSGQRFIDIGGYASFGQFNDTGGAVLASNTYYDGANWVYKNTNAATLFTARPQGQCEWYSAAMGTAGQPISFNWLMTLGNEGNLLVAGSGTFGGNVSATGRLSTAGITEDASGNLLVGTSTFSGNPLQGFILAPNNGETFSAIGHVSGTPSGGWYENFSYNGASIGTITQSGTTSVAYNTTSDHRLKENIRPANAGRFNDIKFVDFEWIDGRHDCGVIAHQLQEIYPDLVIGEKDATEIRKVEITPAVPAVTEQKLVSEAIFNEDGEEIEPAVYETIEITPAVEAVFEDQEFPVYQQVNYIGLIGRMGTRIQMLDKLATEQAEVISKLEARLSAIEAKLN